MAAVHDALCAVMAEVGSVAKRDKNNHQNFMFRGIDAVVNAVGPALRKHELIVVPRILSVDYETVQTSTGKPATACRVVVSYVFCARDGSEHETTVAGEAWDSGDKATPKAMSVAFRTALLQALSLPTDETDPDAQTYDRDVSPAPRRSPNGNPAPKDPAKVVQDTLSKAGVPLSAFSAYLGVEHGVERFAELDRSMQESIATGISKGILLDDVKKHVEQVAS